MNLDDGIPIPDFNLALHDRMFGTRHCEALRCKLDGQRCDNGRHAACDCWACRNWRRWDADQAARRAG